MTVAFEVSSCTWVDGSWAELDALQSLEEGANWSTGTVVPGVAGTSWWPGWDRGG